MPSGGGSSYRPLGGRRRSLGGTCSPAACNGVRRGRRHRPRAHCSSPTTGLTAVRRTRAPCSRTPPAPALRLTSCEQIGLGRRTAPECLARPTLVSQSSSSCRS
eukprot:4742938-Lingulodinium_polyedra.AAC.2